MLYIISRINSTVDRGQKTTGT